MEKTNALQSLLGYTPTPIQVTHLYASWLKTFRKFSKLAQGHHDPMSRDKAEKYKNKIDALLQAAKKVYSD